MLPLFDTFDMCYIGSKNDLNVYGGEIDPNWNGSNGALLSFYFNMQGSLV